MTAQEIRSLRRITLQADLVVVGGGLAGVCCSLTAAREGLKIVLIQDRPVLGGNASSEVRLWALGATSHMGNNNRWAREGGIIDEIFVENVYRNPEGNPHLFDALLLDKVAAEPGITLLLNTAVFSLEKSDAETITELRAFCSQNETHYEVSAPLFCDASGDGVVGFLAGAAFRMGAEAKEEFGEGFAPDRDYGELLGHSIFFYSKDTGRPVRFVAPDFALADVSKIPRFAQINANEHGCQFWWLEYGGRLDTIHETEQIKWELWRVVYGVWNHIKNSGRFPQAENLTLEWVGTIPGKRESRRFEGDYIMVQQDVVEQRQHPDAVAFGGWAIDLHPADGVYSEKPGCTQWHSKGVYQIPFRSLYSRNLNNLFLAGRIISVSHVAFGSTRVMATTAHTAQAVGMAAVLCQQTGLRPRDLLRPDRMAELQQRLLRTGHYIPRIERSEEHDLAAQSRVQASSTLSLKELLPGIENVPLDIPRALLVPLMAGPVPQTTFYLDVETATEIEVQFRLSSREDNFTPDRLLGTQRFVISPGKCLPLTSTFDLILESGQYAFFCLMPTAGVSVRLSEQRLTGVLSLHHGSNRKVSKSAIQNPPADLGIDTFEFWLPERRPGGHNLAATFEPPLGGFDAENVVAGPARPTAKANAWVADLQATAPCLSLTWKTPQIIGRIEILFDTDSDHAMETVQWGHPETAMPFCVKHYRVLDENNSLVAERKDNHQTRNILTFSPPLHTSKLFLECVESHGDCPAAVFRLRCYES